MPSTWSRAATLGVYDQGEDRMTLYADVQYPHRVRNMLAQNVFKVPESKMRVIAQDVGGGFGTKGWQYVEHRLTLVGGAQAAASREVDLRALRSGDGRRAWPRQCRRDRAGPRQGQQVRRAPPQHAGEHRRLCRVRPQPAVALRHDRHGAGRLPDPQGLSQRRSVSSPTPTRRRPIAARGGRRRSISSNG